MTHHPDIDASEIDVEVQNGEVTLKGNVEERNAKRMTEDIAEGVSGVKQVHNQLRVGGQHQQHGQTGGSQTGSSSSTTSTAGAGKK